MAINNQNFRVKNGLEVGASGSNLHVTSDGKVGINTTDPLHALDVRGNLSVGSSVTADSFYGNIPSDNLTGTISTERLTGTYDINISGSLVGDNSTLNTIGVSTANVFKSLNVGVGSTGVFASSDGNLTVTGNLEINEGGKISGPSELIIDPAPVGVGTTSGAVYIKGDLYVQGSQFQVDSTTVNIADKVIGIATTCTTDALLDGAGIGIGPDNNQKTFTWNDTSDSLKSSEHIDLADNTKKYKINGTSVLSNTQVLGKSVTSNNTSNTIVARDNSGNFNAGTITADLTGTASKASNLEINATNNLLIQTSNNNTGTLSNSSTAGYLLKSNATNAAPGWVNPTTLIVGYASTAGIASTATAATSAESADYATSAGTASNADNVAVAEVADTNTDYHQLAFTKNNPQADYDLLYAPSENNRLVYQPSTHTFHITKVDSGQAAGIVTGASYFGDNTQNFIAQSSPIGVGNSNVIIGDLAGISTFVGADDKINNSVLIGEHAGKQHRKILDSVVIGKNNLSNVTSENSVIVGNNIGIATDGATSNASSGLDNGIYIGRNIYNNTTKQLNYSSRYPILIGENILSLNVEESGSGQPIMPIVIGYEAAKRRIAANWDIYIGTEAGQGTENQSLISNPNNDDGVSGSNIMLGLGAGRDMSYPKRSVVIGTSAGNKVAANDNILIGSQAGFAVTTGSSNILIGANAGYELTEGSQNIVIGSGPQPTSGYVLGDGPEVNDTSGDRQLVIGAGRTDRWISGDSNFNIGIGHTYGDTISAKLDVKGDVNVSGSVTATSFVGVADSATKVYVDESEDDNQYYNIIFSDENSDIGDKYHTLQVDNGGLSFNPGTNTFHVGGSISLKSEHTIVPITTSHTSTAGISSTIDTFAISSYDLAEYTIHVGYGTYIQAQKVLVMHDGTTAYAQEYAIMSDPSKIVSIDATISGSNVLLQAIPETGISGITTYKIVRGGLV